MYIVLAGSFNHFSYPENHVEVRRKFAWLEVHIETGREGDIGRRWNLDLHSREEACAL